VNRNVSSRVRKVVRDGADVTTGGRQFHTWGSATENAVPLTFPCRTAMTAGTTRDRRVPTFLLAYLCSEDNKRFSRTRLLQNVIICCTVRSLYVDTLQLSRQNISDAVIARGVQRHPRRRKTRHENLRRVEITKLVFMSIICSKTHPQAS